MYTDGVKFNTSVYTNYRSPVLDLKSVEKVRSHELLARKIWNSVFLGEGEIIVLFQNFRFFKLDLCVGTAPQNLGTAPRFWGSLPLCGDKTFPKYV